MSSETKVIQNNRIIKIKVRSLFGLFDYDIPLDDNGVTILIGVNGSGKTTMFKILYSILNKEFYNILDIDFKSFEINFYNGDVIICERFVQNIIVNDLVLNIAGNKQLENRENFRCGIQKLWEQSKTLTDFLITIKSKDSRLSENPLKFTSYSSIFS